MGLAFDSEAFKSAIACARTFGFAERIEELWSHGLAQGGSLKNTVVVSRDRVLNEEGLRFPDEFVRHKVLDSLGDLYLAGAPLRGRFIGRSAGHTMHNKLLRALFADPAAWRMVDDSGAGRAALAGEACRRRLRRRRRQSWRSTIAFTRAAIADAHLGILDLANLRTSSIAERWRPPCSSGTGSAGASIGRPSKK